jgi:ATP-binding cassette subfamily B protein
LVEEPPADPANDWADMLDDAMGRVLPGQSVIICPSRLPTLAASDRIVVMDRGKVNAVGTHQALSADNALYRHMLRAGF